jgi:beta-glucanase (GH16 family)
VGQPGTGEIDVFEAIGSATSQDPETSVVHQTVWSSGAGSARKSATVRVPGGPAAGFHTYAVQWQEHSIAWYVDGRRTFLCDEHNAPWLATALRGKFFLRINLAVGGSWPGTPTDSTAFPADMVIDWARVYQNS